MYPYLNEQIAAQRQAEMREQAARVTGHRQARQAHRMPQASPGRGASSRPETRHRHPVRRRAGYALISIGLRLAYAAGED